MLRKFASAQILGVESPGHQRVAHRHEFGGRRRPGYIYVRSRAISSRRNDNFDTFPAEEIKKAYRTFIGKPVFVNHSNANHRRCRGVIVDAALHEDVTPDGLPDTWVEVFMEVDAVRYPKLAEAIRRGHIERTSMGCDVAYSRCTACGNVAKDPSSYCAHIPAMKGQVYRRYTASGQSEDVVIAEECYGLSFFENSLLVEDPADPTAFFLGVEDYSEGVTAKTAFPVGPMGWSDEVKTDIAKQVRKRRGWVLTDDNSARLEYANIRGIVSVNYTGEIRADLSHDGQRIILNRTGTYASATSAMNAVERYIKNRYPSFVENAGPAQEMYYTDNPAQYWDRRPLAKNAARLGYGETKAPARIDTLRSDHCPVCGEDENFAGGRCAICGFEQPPDFLTEPDLDRARENDLREGEEELRCDNCDATFPLPDAVRTQGAVRDGDDDEASVADPADDADAPEQSVEDAASGDVCPRCGEGRLWPSAVADGVDDEGQDPADEDEDDDEEAESLNEDEGQGQSPDGPDRQDRRIRSNRSVSMRPALATLVAQQQTIEEQARRIAALEGAVGAIARLAGLEGHPAVIGVLAAEIPAQEGDLVTVPPAQAPVVTTDQAVQPAATTEPDAMGTVLPDVAPETTDDPTTAGGVGLDAPAPMAETDPDAPVAGTETTNGDNKITTDVRIDRPTNEVDQPLNTATRHAAFTVVDAGGKKVAGPFDDRSDAQAFLDNMGQDDSAHGHEICETGGSKEGRISESRGFAALRLARLRMQAGITPATDDIVLASEISADASLTDAAISTEIATLAAVVAAQPRQQAPEPQSRQLVPRSARRTVPSMTSAPAPVVTGHAPSDDEFLW